MTHFCTSDGWGPLIPGKLFVFTPCFANTILTGAPLAFLLCFGTMKLYKYWKLREKPAVYIRDILYFTKFGLSVLLFVLVCLQAILDFYSDDISNSRYFALFMQLIGIMMATKLLDYEHICNLRSSSIVISYYFLWILSTAIISTLVDSFRLVLLAEILLPLFIIFLENFPRWKKRDISRYSFVESHLTEDSDIYLCPEDTAGFIESITFSWMNGIMKKGYEKPLSAEDLWKLGYNHRSQKLGQDFAAIWDKERLKPKASLFQTFVKCYGAEFMFAAFFKFFQDLLQFIQPQLLSSLILFIESHNPLGSPDVIPQPPIYGFIIAGTMFLTAVFQSCLLHQYFHRCIITGMHVRGGVTTAIYKKSLLLSSTSRKDKTIGEIVNLMSVDSQRFMDLAAYLHIAWSAPLQIALALYLLYQTMGASIFSGVGIMILMVPVNGFLATKTRALQKSQMENKDNRMKMMDEILNGIKVIKLYAWESIFLKTVDDVREKELSNLKRIGLLSAVQSFTWACTPLLVSFATFTTYVYTSETPLTADKLFVSIALFNLLQFPLALFPTVISGMIEASVAMTRVRNFLTAEEVENYVESQQFDESNEKTIAISVRNASFKWEKEGDFILKNINFKLETKTLLAVLGKVGSGKSSIMGALLGEMYAASEVPGFSVRMNGKVAYVGQQAWIMNSTLRENILFDKPYDRDFYLKTIQVCGLAPDVEVLPGGDLTEIGERGINLSGGQKQRVSIARAVYANCDVYLFDDPLSAVDAHVGRHIFEEVIGPRGILRNKTRLFVTHAIQYLNECDLVMVIKDGEIVEGPKSVNDTLKDETSEVKRLISEHSSSDIHSPKIGASASRQAPLLSVKKPMKPATSMLDMQMSSNSLIVKEDSAKGKVSFEVYKVYAKASSYISVFVAILFMILSQVASVSTNIWLKDWGSENARHGGNFEVTKYIVVYALLGITYCILTVSQVIIIWVYCAIRSSRVLHAEVLRSVINSPMSFFDTTPLGRIINRFAKDIYTIDETLPRSFLSYFRTLFSVLTIIFVITISTPLFLVLILPMGVIYFFTQRYYLATSRELKRLDSVSRSPIYAHFSETLSGVSTIRAYGQSMRFINENETKLDKNLEAYYPSVASNRWLAIRLEFLGAIVIFGSSLFGTVGVLYFKNIDAGLAGLSVSYALTVTQTLNWMVRQACEIETNIVSVERLKEYIELVQESSTAVDRPLVDNLPLLWPQKGSVEFRNYSCRYRNGMDCVLKDVSFFVNFGEKVGIVGRSGAGKSSLMSALFRLIEAASGSILIDGVDISSVSLHDLRSRITIIPQDPVLFATSIRNNLDPLKQHADNEIWRAIESAHMKEKIKTLSDGLDSTVLQNGENFSVGQRQLLCLARAILRRSKVLVLDEATAAIDVETDDFIQETIRTEFKACTVLTIAHRINTIVTCDKVIVMDNGKIAECDSPKKLLSDKNSMFFGLAKQGGITISK